MQLFIETWQLIHERYEQQSVYKKQLSEDFRVSPNTMKTILNSNKDNLSRRAGSGNPGKIDEREY